MFMILMAIDLNQDMDKHADILLKHNFSSL